MTALTIYFLSPEVKVRLYERFRFESFFYLYAGRRLPDLGGVQRLSLVQVGGDPRRPSPLLR